MRRLGPAMPPPICEERSMSESPLVSVVMGSDSDWPVMEQAVDVVAELVSAARSTWSRPTAHLTRCWRTAPRLPTAAFE
jgi:hypothetical protein